MNEFALYFWLGIQHILDINGIDHILFIIALSVPYSLVDWKKVVFLATAFTLGHSLTLILSVLNLISIPSSLIEGLIPITIILTAIRNISSRTTKDNHWLALFFGFVHGCGFSNYLRELLGETSSIVTPLFAFNVGLEIGQIVILLITLLLGFLSSKLFHVEQFRWSRFVSVIVLVAAIYIFIDGQL